MGNQKKKTLLFVILGVLFLVSLVGTALYLSVDRDAGKIKISKAYLSKYSTKLEGNIININENNKANSKGFDEVNYIVTYNLSENPGVSTRPVDIVATLDSNEQYATFKGTNQSGVRSELSVDMKALTIHVDNASVMEQNNIQITMLIQGAPNGYQVRPQIKIKEATEEEYTNVEVTTVEVISNSLRGKVTDESDMAVSDILVTLRKNGRLIKETYTKEDGTYSFSDIDKGTYEVLINEEIYEKVNNKNVVVNDDAILNIKVKQVDPYKIETHKYITKLRIKNNGVEEVYDYGEVTLAQASIKKFKDISGEIYFKITVENKGKKSGIVTVVKDELPKGLKFDESKNGGWEIVDGVIYNRTLEGITLGAGETREETLILDIENTNEARTYINKITAKGEIYEKVVFLINGSKYKEREVLEGEKIKEPETGIANLDGWYTDEEYTNKYNFNNSVNKDLILYARTVTDKCKVTFMDYGEIWDEQTIDCGTTPRRPSDPAHDGYDLKCWKTSSGCVDFDLPIEEDTIIESSYNLITYNITYDLDGGSLPEETTNPSTYTVETDSFTLNNPSKTYYDFIGWTGSNGDEPEETVTIEKGSTGNKEYTANYIKQRVNVKFIDKGEVISNEDVDKGSIIQSISVSKRGYTFKYWTADNETAFNFNNPILENTTLYSVYEIINYNLAYNLDGGRLPDGVTNPNSYTVETETFTLNNPSKPGYSFEGWSEDGGEEILNPKAIEKGTIGNKTLTANYKIINYNITYELNGGSLEDGVSNPSKYTVETNTFTLNNPSKTGYTFTGWTGTGLESKTLEVSVPKGSTGNRTYEANYDINVYNVEFYHNDSLVKTLQVEYNDLIDQAEVPVVTKEGYTFTFWSLKNESEGYDFTTRITKNIKLYSNFVKQRKAVIFNDENRITEVTVDWGDTVNPITDKGKTGYTFSHWSLNTGGEAFDFETPILEPTTLYAVYNINTYNITYNLDGGEVTGNPSTYTVETDDFTLNNPTKTGYNFTGWTGTELEEKTMEVVIEKGSTGNRSYTANYKKKKYTVSYIDKGSEYASEQVEYKDKTTRPSTDPEKRGYTFSHWSLNENGEAFDFNTEIVSNTNLYSVYTINTYNLTYELDGGSLPDGVSNPSTYTVETNDFTLNNPSKTGYNFIGWTEEDEEPSNPKTITKGTIGNKTLTANYEVIEYTISYILNDGTLEEQNPSTYTIETETFTLNNPSKVGYDFTGWTGTDLVEATTTVSIQKGSTGNRSYTANFERIYFNVTFYDKDPENPTSISQIGDPVSVAYGEKVSEINHPEHTGFDSDGWLDDNDDRYSFDLPVTSNLSLTANYKKKKYDVIYMDEGEQYASYRIEYKDLATRPSDPDRSSEHKIFKGWLLNNEAYDFNTPVTTDIELVSSYEAVAAPTISYSPTTWTNQAVIAEVTSTHEDYTYQYKVQGVDENYNNYNPETKITVGSTGNCLPTDPCTVIAKSNYNNVSSATTSLDVINIERIDPIIKSVEATALDVDNATITITTQDNESGMDYIKIYLDDVYQADISYENNKQVDEDSSKTQEKVSNYTFNNLESNTTYEVQIVAYDAAGNQTTSEKVQFTTMEEEGIVAILIAVNNVPLEEITENEQFSKLKKAIEDPRCVSQQCTIQMVDNTRESVSVLEGQDITLDVNGHTIAGVRDYTINNTGLLTIIDDAGVPGIISNNTGVALRNDDDGVLTLGINGENEVPSITAPSIYGAQLAVEKLSGTFRFYDGRLEGTTAIYGVVDDTPYSYNASVATTETTQVSTLRQIEDPEARIGSTYYTKAQLAVDDARNGQQIKKTNLLKGFTTSGEYGFEFNDETNNLESNNNVANTTATSTEEIDLSSFALDQTLYFNARLQNGGTGTITVTELDTNNELISNLATAQAVTEETDQTITFKLKARKRYAVTLEYNSPSENAEDSKMIVSNMVLAEYKEDVNTATNPEIAAIKNYGFRYDSETHELKSENQYASPSRAFSYMEIDLTNETNKKDLLINAYLETYRNSSIYAYIIINETLDIPSGSSYYPSDSNTKIAEIVPSSSYGDSFIKIGSYNYVRTLDPGKKYYLSFIYQKSMYSGFPPQSVFEQYSNKDQFVIKSIDLVDSIDSGIIDLSTSLVTAADSDFSFEQLSYNQNQYTIPEIENTRTTDPDIKDKMVHSYVEVDLTNQANDMTALVYMYYGNQIDFYGAVTDSINLPASTDAFASANISTRGIQLSYGKSWIPVHLIGGRKNYIHYVYNIGDEVDGSYYSSPQIGNIKLVNAVPYDFTNAFENYSGDNYVKDPTDSYRSSTETYAINLISGNSINDSAVEIDLTNSSTDQYMRINAYFKYYNEKYIYVTTDDSFSGASYFLTHPNDSLVKFHYSYSSDGNQYKRNNDYSGDFIEIDYILPKGNKYYIHFVTSWGTTSYDQTHDSFEINYLLLSPITNHDIDIGELSINKVQEPPQTVEGIILEDETEDKNTRFISSNTNNYISFNSELWRIVGIFETEDASGNKARRLKIVRNSSIGNFSWDSSQPSNYGSNGTNQWGLSDIMQLLNPGYDSETYGGSLYWNRTDGNCFSGSTASSCDFRYTGLTTTAKTYIDEVKWNVGMLNTPNSSDQNLSLYTLEKASTWLGKVGLLSVSDMIYTLDAWTPASTGSPTRNSCMTDSEGMALVCLNNNSWWHSLLVNSGNTTWTMTGSSMDPPSFLDFMYGAGSSSDSFGLPTSNQAYGIFPSVYLSTKTYITGGKGTSGNPYTIGLGENDNDDEYYGLIDTGEGEGEDEPGPSWIQEEETDDYENVITRPVYGFSYDAATNKYTNLNQNEPSSSAAIVFTFDLTGTSEDTNITLKYNQVSYSSNSYDTRSFVNLYPNTFVPQDYTIVNTSDYSYGLQGDGYKSGTTAGSYNITLTHGIKNYLQVVFNTGAIGDKYEFSIISEKYNTEIKTYIPELNRDPDKVELLKDVTLENPLDIIDTKNVILDLNGHTITNRYNDYVVDNKGSLEIIDSKYINEAIQDEQVYQEELEKYESDLAIYNEYINSEQYTIDQIITNNFEYTGDVQTFTAPYTGKYSLEVWGASGGDSDTSVSTGGKGGYTYGEILLNQNDVLKVYVGGKGLNGKYGTIQTGGYNGGGNSGYYYGGSGGGATDIRITGDTLYNRIIVAGGGGGAGYYSSYNGGAGGGLQGLDGTGYSNYYAKGATQTEGGKYGGYMYSGVSGSFGNGGRAHNTSNTYSRSGGGGGGWYGGGGGGYYSNRTNYYYSVSGGGGGSGFAYDGTNTTPTNYNVGSYVLTNTRLLDGTYSMPSHDGNSIVTGNTGNGFAKITLIDEEKIEELYDGITTYDVKFEPTAPVKTDTIHNGKVYSSSYTSVLNEKNAYLEIDSSIIQTTAANFNGIENLGSTKVNKDGVVTALTNGIHSSVTGDILDGEGYVSSFKIVNNDSFSGYNTGSINIDKNITVTANDINKDKSNIANVTVENGSTFNSDNSKLSIYAKTSSSKANISNSTLRINNYGQMVVSDSILFNDDNYNNNYNYFKITLNNVTGPSFETTSNTGYAQTTTINGGNISVLRTLGTTTITNGFEADDLYIYSNGANTNISDSTINNKLINQGTLVGDNISIKSFESSGTYSPFATSTLTNVTFKDGKIDIEKGTVTLSNGTMSSSDGSSIASEAIYVGENAKLVILEDFEIDNYNTGIKTDVNSEVTLGNNEDEVKNDIIIRGNNEGIVNTKRGIFNYYDGMIISDKDNVIKTPINATPVNYDLDSTLNGDVKTVFLSRYDDQNRESVARIGNTEYKSLQAAFEAVVDSTDTTIVLLKNIDTLAKITVPAERNITLDLDGNSINTLSGDLFTNSGNLTIEDGEGTANITVTGTSLINNNGNATLNVNVTAGSPFNRLLYNTSELVIEGGTYTIPYNNIDKQNYGSSIMDLQNFNGILHNTGHTVIMNGQFVNTNDPLYYHGYGTDNYCNNEQCILLYNEGTIDVYDGTFDSIIRVYNYVNISGGAFNKEFYGTYNYDNDTYERYNHANISITGGTFDSYIENAYGCTMTIDGVTLPAATTYNSIKNSGTMTIAGSDIDRYLYNYDSMEIVSGNISRSIENSKNLVIDDINLTSYISADNTNSNITIKSGSIVNNGSYGINAKGNLTLGEDDGDIKVRPYISGKYYGINSNGTLNLNFYDGYVKGQTAIDGTVVINDKASGVDIITDTETIDNFEYEIKYLGNASLLKNTRTNVEYNDFQTAIDEAVNGDTIQLLRTYIMPSNLGTIEVDSAKDISIDLNGYSISKQNSNLLLDNDGTLHIYSLNKVVTIASAYKTNFIDNSGTLIMERVDLTNASGNSNPGNVLIDNSGTLDMTYCHHAGYGNDTIINNTGTMKMHLSNATGYDSSIGLINSGTFNGYAARVHSNRNTAVNNSGTMTFEPSSLYYKDKLDDEQTLANSIAADECTKSGNQYTCTFSKLNTNNRFRYCFEPNGEISCSVYGFNNMIGVVTTDYYYGDFTVVEDDNKYSVIYGNLPDILNMSRDSFVKRSSIDTYIYGSDHNNSSNGGVDPDLIINTNNLKIIKASVESYGLNKLINSDGTLDVEFSNIYEKVDASQIIYDYISGTPNIVNMMDVKGTSTFNDVQIDRHSTANKTTFNFWSGSIPQDIWAINSYGNLTMNKVNMKSRLNAGVYTQGGIANITDSTIEAGYLSNRATNAYKSDRYGIYALDTLNLTNTNISSNINAIEFRGDNLTINGGNIESYGYGYYNQNKLTEVPTIVLVSGTTNLVAGKVNGIYGRAISVGNNATLNVGTNDETVSTTSPEISATMTSSYNGRWPALDSYGIVNFYDGVFKSKETDYGQIKGKVTSVETGYQIIKDGDSKYLSTDDLVKIEKSGSDIRYYSDFNSAIADAANGDTLEMLREFTQVSGDSAITIPSGLNITIDLGGYKYLGNSEYSIVNNGTLSVINGTAISSSDYLITNNGTLSLGDDNHTLDMDKSNVLNNANATLSTKANLLNKINNYGTSNIISGTVHELVNSSGTTNLQGGSITRSTGGYAVENSGILNVTGGLITNNCQTATNNQYCTENGINNEIGGEINISGDTARIDREVLNNGDLNVNNYCNNSSSNCILDVKTNNGDVEIYDSKINITNIDNSGSVLINNSSLQFIGGGITNNGTMNVDNNSVINTIVTSCNISIDNSTVSYLTNNCNDESLVSITSSTINGFTNTGRVELDGNTFGHITNNSYDSYINFISGTVTNGFVNKGTLIIGTLGGNVSTTDPSITADSTYGLETTAQGHTYFYDGVISGNPLAISGVFEDLEPGYTIKYDTNTETGVQSATLKVIGPDDARIAVVAGLNFDRIQSAVNYAANNNINAITLYADITLDSDLVIPAGKTTTIYLNGYTITENGFTIDSNITISNDPAPTGASILGAILGTVSKNVIVYEMEDGTELSPERSYKLYKLDGSDYNLVKMNRDEEIGRYKPGSKDVAMKTVRSRIYLKDLSDGNYKLKDDLGKEITFVIDENGLVSPNVLEYYETNTKGRVESTAVATLILSIQTGIAKVSFTAIIFMLLIGVILLFALRKNKVKE